MAIGLGLFDHLDVKISRGNFFIPGIAFLATIFFLPNVNEISWALMFVYLFVGIGMFLILFSTTRHGKSPSKTLLSNPLLVYLGKISYGLYIFHLIAIRFAYQICNSFVNTGDGISTDHTSIVFLISLVLTLFFSALSYRFIERPFLKLKEKFSLVPSRPI
jgi:peptidoglycan/LPS O-acetylase OafA/YrhL